MNQYFDILKLPPGASWKEIKRAYKSEVKCWHPDRFPVDDAQAQKKAHDKFQKIGEAYRFLEKVYGTRTRSRFKDDQPSSSSQRPFSAEDPTQDRESNTTCFSSRTSSSMLF